MRKLRRTLIPRYYYHITRQFFWGEKITLYPQPPTCFADGEPDFPRICVAPTVPQCFAAISLGLFSMYVYRTLEKVRVFGTYDVNDVHITHEKWIFDNTDFVRTAIIDSKLVSLFPSSSRGSDKGEQRQKQLEDYRAIKTYLDNDGSLKQKAVDALKQKEYADAV